MSTMHQRAVELEKQLAEAQGHEVAFVGSSGTVWVREPDGNKRWLPRPARDVADNLNLMLEVGVWPREVQTPTGPVFEVVDSDGWVCYREPVPVDGDRKAVLLIAVVAGAVVRLRMLKKVST